MSDWTKEPWEQDERYIVAELPSGRPGGEVIISCQPTTTRREDYPASERIANAARVVACVNACAGMADPAAEISRLRAALGERLMAMRGIVGKRISHSGACMVGECKCPPEDQAFFAALSAPGGVGEKT